MAPSWRGRARRGDARESPLTGRLAGEVALVTGAGRGFGRAIAERFASEGAAVALMARRSAEVEEVAAVISKRRGKAVALPGDVTKPADVERVVSETEERFGPVSLFVNNAGTPGPFGPIWEIDVTTWWASQAVHVLAPMLFLRRILPGMRERDKGRIIVISAFAARLVTPALSAYSTGKVAQNKIVAEAAAELADTAVKIFAIHPGVAFTDLGRETVNSPEAQKWLPGMVRYIANLETAEDADVTLARCAELCTKLAEGRYDALTGRYVEVAEDIDALAAEAERAAREKGEE